MISDSISDADKASGIVARFGQDGSIPVRAIDSSNPPGLGAVVVIDLDQCPGEVREFYKEERRWVVLKSLPNDEFLLAPATTKAALVGQKLPGLKVVMAGKISYAGFDSQDAILHPSMFEKFKKNQILGKIGQLKPDECLAVLAALDAGLGIGTGSSASPGANKNHPGSRRGTIWKHVLRQGEIVLVSCHPYSFTDGAPHPAIPLLPVLTSTAS